MQSEATYDSLQDYLSKTGSTQRALALQAKMTETHLSMLLRGSRRCSIRTALKLAAVTGVPVEKLVKWPKVRVTRSYLSVA